MGKRAPDQDMSIFKHRAVWEGFAFSLSLVHEPIIDYLQRLEIGNGKVLTLGQRQSLECCE